MNCTDLFFAFPGVTVIVVGIGRRTDEGELRRIAGKDGKVYHVESFKDLMTLDMLDGVTKAACVRGKGFFESFKDLVTLE